MVTSGDLWYEIYVWDAKDFLRTYVEAPHKRLNPREEL